MKNEKRASNIISRVFAVWGTKSAGKFGILSSVLALILSIILSVGIRNVEFYQSVTEIWAADGSQSRRDRALYNHAFGGIGREAALVITSQDENSVLAKSQINALLTVSKEIPSITVGSAKQADFCSRPEVPALLRKTPPGPLQYAFAATFHSYGYAKITRCLADNDVFDDSSLKGLEETWGITRFPCSRVSALDCFREGDYDYPQELKELDVYARLVVKAKVENRDTFDKCSNELGEEFLVTLSQGALLLPVDQQAQFRNEMKVVTEQIMLALVGEGGTVDLFATWGFGYKPEFLPMSDQDVSKYMSTALSNLQNDTFDNKNCFAGVPCCLSWSGIALDAASAFGDISEDRAEAIRTAYFHNSADDSQWAESVSGIIPNSNSSAARLEALESLEQSIIDKFQPRFAKQKGSGFASNEEYGDSNLDFYTSRSSSDILRDAGQTPLALVGIGYAIIAFYIMFVFANYKSFLIYSRILLGIGSVVILSLGTLAGFGVMGWAGVRLSPLATNVLPFAILGIGVDDVFLIVFTLLDNSHLSENPKERMNETLAAVGPSVTLTSLSLIIGFLFSALVRIPAVYSFAYQLATTIAINYVLLIFLFVPLCAWDSFRVAEARPDLAPCITLDSKDGEGEQELYANGTILAKASYFIENRISSSRVFKGRLFGIITAVISLIFTIAMLIVSFLLSERGLSLNSIALRGSYQRSFLEIQERAFPLATSYLVHVAEEDMGEESLQSAMISHGESIQNAFGTSDRPALRSISWLYGNPAALLTQYNSPRGINLTRPIPRSDFYNEFATWTFAGAGSSQLSSVRCTTPDDDTGLESAEFVSCASPISINDLLDSNKGKDKVLRISRMSFVQRNLRDNSDYVKAIVETRRAIREPSITGLRAFVYGSIYELWDQYVTTYWSLFKVLGLTLLGVAVAAFLLLPPLVALITVMVLISLAVQLVGICVLIGISFNAISILNFAVGISMSIEFSAHYSNAFALHGNGALRRTLPAITAGAISTLLSLLPMIWSRFPFVRLYYYAAWTIMTVLAYINAAVVLPLVLLLFLGKPKLRSLGEGENISGVE